MSRKRWKNPVITTGHYTPAIWGGQLVATSANGRSRGRRNVTFPIVPPPMVYLPRRRNPIEVLPWMIAGV